MPKCGADSAFPLCCSTQTLQLPAIQYRNTGLIQAKEICLGANTMGLSLIQSPSQAHMSINPLPDLGPSVARNVSSPQRNHQPSWEMSRESNQSRKERTKIHYK